MKLGSRNFAHSKIAISTALLSLLSSQSLLSSYCVWLHIQYQHPWFIHLNLMEPDSIKKKFRWPDQWWPLAQYNILSLCQHSKVEMWQFFCPFQQHTIISWRKKKSRKQNVMTTALLVHVGHKSILDTIQSGSQLWKCTVSWTAYHTAHGVKIWRKLGSKLVAG